MDGTFNVLEFCCRLSASLCVIHGRVRIPHQIVRRRMSFRSMQDANAARTVDLGSVDIERHEEVSMDPFSDQRYFRIVIFSFHQDNEFISTKPRAMSAMRVFAP